MYRKRYHAITLHRVVEFLILDRSFPRAVRFCICRADESLHEIAGTPSGSYRNIAEQRMGRLKAELDYTDVTTIVNGGLHEFIDDLQGDLNAIGEAINETFFAIRPVGQVQMQSQG
jgi:uncharacterized alpha-E superfamily protein